MYKHLSREERYQIYSLLKAKQTISQIARLLGRSRSTIGRGRSRVFNKSADFVGLAIEAKLFPLNARVKTVDNVKEFADH
jgi:IS30 family transposase